MFRFVIASEIEPEALAWILHTLRGFWVARVSAQIFGFWRRDLLEFVPSGQKPPYPIDCILSR